MNKSLKIFRTLVVIVMTAATCVAGLSVLSQNGMLPPSLPYADQINAVFGNADAVEPEEPGPVYIPISPTDVPADPIVEPEVEQVQQVPEITAFSPEIRQNLQAIAEGCQCAAVQIALINDGYVTNTYSYGYTNIRDKKMLNDDTTIRVASLSKVFVGMVAMRAQEEGHLTLDEPLTDQLGYKVRSPYYPRSPLTLRNFLTHTATVRDAAMIGGCRLPNFLRDKDTYFLGAPPGTERSWQYSNAGIRAAGGIIEELAGATMPELSDQYFFDGLGIEASFFPCLLEDKDNIATLYYGSKEVSHTVAQQLAKPYYDVPAKNCTVFAGGLTITARDFAKLMCVLVRDGEYGGQQYLTPESVAQMQEVNFVLDDYDQCIVLRHKDNLYGRELYFHTGDAYGVLSFAAYDEQTGEGVVIVTVGSRRASRDDSSVPVICAEFAKYLFDDVLDGQPIEN